MRTGHIVMGKHDLIPSHRFSLRTYSKALSYHNRIYDAIMMDAYLLSAPVGCYVVLKAPTVGAINCRF